MGLQYKYKRPQRLLISLSLQQLLQRLLLLTALSLGQSGLAVGLSRGTLFAPVLRLSGAFTSTAHEQRKTEWLPSYPYCNKHLTDMNAIHISTARRILQAPEPVSLRCWTKSGAILELHDAIPLKYNFYEGTQQFNLLSSRQIRTIRLNLIFELNGTEVFL